jgi:hypothetical protein
MSYLRTCPRCNDRSYEVLKTHAYCVSCNYSPDLMAKPMSSDDLAIPPWAEKFAAKSATPKDEHPNVEAEHSTGGAA